MRWHEGDDGGTVAAGWFVDSVTLSNVGTCATPNTLFSDGFESGTLGTWSGSTP